MSEIKVKRLEEPRKLADASAYRLPEPKVDGTGWDDLLVPLTPAIVEKNGNGWRLENGKLFSSKTKFARLPLSDRYAGTSYRLKIKLRQVEVKDIFRVALPVGDRAVCFYLDGNPNEGFDTALGCVDGGFGRGQRGAVAGKQIKDSALHELEVTVRLDGANVKISSTLDSRRLHEWAGPIASLSMIGDWAGNPPGNLARGSVADDWVVSEVKVKRLEAAASPDPQAGRPPARATPARPAPGLSPAVEVWTDLLAGLTAAVVKKTGHGWEKKGSTLHSPAAPTAVLPLPGAFSGTSYQVRLRVRQETAIETFVVSLPVGDRMAAFVLDGWGGPTTSLLAVNGRGGSDVPGALVGRQMKDLKPHDLEVSVRLDERERHNYHHPRQTYAL